jgi:hypothetical protein
MPLEQGPTPKQDYWEQIVLPAIPGLVAGTYTNPQISVSASGLVTAVAPSGAVLPIVSNIASLSTIPSPSAGAVAVVLDSGGGVPALFIYNTTPSPGWYQLTFPGQISAQSQSFTFSSTFPIQFKPVNQFTLWKRLSVTIKTGFTGGTTFSLIDSASVIWMPTTAVLPGAPGTYEFDLTGNDVAAGTGLIMNLVMGGAPSVGSGTVYVEYL